METLPRDSHGPAPDRSDDDVFVFPSSFAQQRLWFLDQVDPGSAVYNVPLAFRLDGPVNPAALTAALQELVNRHEALRTTFGAPEGVPSQIVAPHQTLAIETIDLRATPIADRARETARLSRAAAARPFVLDRGPLFRVTLGRLDDESWLLVLNVHHIVCDGSSLGLLLGELSRLYPAFAATPAVPPDLPPPGLQYADYTVWQTERFAGGEQDGRLAFWRESLAGELPVLTLPSDRPRPPIASGLGGQRLFSLTPALTASLAALGRRQGASLFMTLLAAYQVLLYRLGGQPDVLVGTPIVNRDSGDLEASVGFFTNTVVFRNHLGGEPSFRALLGRVKESALRVLAHQDVPFEKVVEAIHPTRATSASPIFQAMFGMQKAPTSALALPGVRVTALPVHPGTSKFDLTLDMQELDDGGMQGLLEYSADLFDDATAARLAGTYQKLLASAAQDPERSIDALELLGDDERRLILHDWNATAAPIPDARIDQLIAAQAGRTPDAVAVVQDDRTMSYGELGRRAGLLAAHLQGLGVGPGAVVALFLERTPELLVALLGTLKAGAAYLPLDPAYPAERVRFMLDDAGAAVIVASAATVDELPEHSARTVMLERDLDADAGAATTSTGTRAAGPDDLAYVIYTSGSTGRPKGVEIPHRALVNFIASMQRQPGLTAGDRLLAVTTLSFDIAALELLLPLSVGATIVLASREDASDGPALLARLRASRATVLQATPATFRLLVASGWPPRAAANAGDWAPLTVLCGGEAMPPDLARALLDRADHVWNMYGPTETTVWSTCAAVTDADDITIGRPIANTQVYVLGSGLQPVPVGAVGELAIGGAGVARGYHGRPDLTAERFVDNPYAAEPAFKRMYRTGDLARFRADGTLECLGRADAQVKVRGFRIELGEIEATLSRHDGVGGVAVAVKDDAAGDRRLVAYVVHAPGESPTASELRKFARRALPDHMIPHLFVFLPALPLTANGKLDRQRLPDPLRETPPAPAEPPAPTTPAEMAIAEIWCEALNVPRVGLTDNFFDVGGHSLLSMQVIHRIQARLGKRLHPRSLAFQTLEQLAAECESDGGAA